GSQSAGDRGSTRSLQELRPFARKAMPQNDPRSASARVRGPDVVRVSDANTGPSLDAEERVSDQRTPSRSGAGGVLVLGVVAALLQAVNVQAQLIITVPANEEWVDTGMEVVQGDQLVFLDRGGEWSNVAGSPVGAKGRTGPFPGTQIADAPLATLIARVQ